MSFANEVIKKLFGQPLSENQSIHSEPFIIDLGRIQRSEKELEAYYEWKHKHASDLIFEFKQNSLFSRQNLTERLNFVWLNTSTANGFQLDLSEAKTPLEHHWYGLELLKERIVIQGYITTHSEYSVTEKLNEIHKREWYYLKTPHHYRIGNPPFEQRFGNIQLELNEASKTKLKLTATTYSDRNYHQPLPFDQLIEAIFG
jgi:hypothetical protein